MKRKNVMAGIVTVMMMTTVFSAVPAFATDEAAATGAENTVAAAQEEAVATNAYDPHLQLDGSGRWTYMDDDGSMAVSDFRTVNIDSETTAVYYFDENGQSVSGSVEIDGALCYFDTESRMTTAEGWFKDSEKAFTVNKTIYEGSGLRIRLDAVTDDNVIFSVTNCGRSRVEGFACDVLAIDNVKLDLKDDSFDQARLDLRPGQTSVLIQPCSLKARKPDRIAAMFYGETAGGNREYNIEGCALSAQEPPAISSPEGEKIHDSKYLTVWKAGSGSDNTAFAIRNNTKHLIGVSVSAQPVSSKQADFMGDYYTILPDIIEDLPEKDIINFEGVSYKSADSGYYVVFDPETFEICETFHYDVGE